MSAKPIVAGTDGSEEFLLAVGKEGEPQTHGTAGVGIADLGNCGYWPNLAFKEASLRHASVLAMQDWHWPLTDNSRAGQMSAAPQQRAVAAGAAEHLDALLEE